MWHDFDRTRIKGEGSRLRPLEAQALMRSICLKSRLIFEVSMFMDCCSHVIAGGGRRVWLKHCDIEGPSKIALACQCKLA